MKKFLIILYILIFIALSYYVVNLFVDRNQEENNQIEIKTQSETINDIDTDVKPPTIPEEEIESISDEKKDAAYTITRDNCDNECATIESTDKKTYCNQVCGFTVMEHNKSCTELNNLHKDYCLRDEAVANKDLSKCNEITDAGIKDQCINRINEEFIDEIM